MPTEKSELYSSPNGDRWFLARDFATGNVFIRHKRTSHQAVGRRRPTSAHFSVEGSDIPSIKRSCTCLNAARDLS